MKRFARPGLLSLLLCLTTFATPATAESTWVLWYMSDASWHWQPRMGYGTVAECKAAVDFAARTALEKAQEYAELLGVDGDVTLHQPRRMSGKGEYTFWRCLPDTIDPRTPKGK